MLQLQELKIFFLRTIEIVSKDIGRNEKKVIIGFSLMILGLINNSSLAAFLKKKEFANSSKNLQMSFAFTL